MAEPTSPNPVPKSAAALPAGAPRPAKPAEHRAVLRRGASLVRRWGRDTFNRESLLSSLRSLAWVLPLTLLIWIYAEREQQADGMARFQIVVRSADPTQVATIVNGSDQNVTAPVKGPRVRLKEALDKLDPRSGAGPVTIVIDGNRTPGQYEVDILAQIQKDYRLDNTGITVQDCNPRHVQVAVDTLQPLELEVRADPQLRVTVPPVFDPPKVSITAPASALKNPKGELYARANLPPLTPGPHSLKSVPLTVEGLGDVKVPIRPPTVSATVEVGQADIDYRIASVPVFPIIAADLRSFVVKHDLTVANVPVQGSPEKIRQLENGTLTPRPEAYFKVTDADVAAKRGTGELQYVLPEGIRRKDDAPKTIPFELVPREPT